MKKFFDFFSEIKHYIILLSSTIIISLIGYFYVQRLPKPETFVELAKYYFNSPSDYLFSIFLFLIISFAYALCAASGTYNTFINWAELGTVSKTFLILFICVLSFLSFYFAAYFVLTLFVILAIAIIAIFVIKVIADN